MPGYGQTMELLGPDTPLSLDEYQLAVRITKSKAAGKGCGYEEILFPYVIRDIVFARWVRERRKSI